MLRRNFLKSGLLAFAPPSLLALSAEAPAAAPVEAAVPEFGMWVRETGGEWIGVQSVISYDWCRQTEGVHVSDFRGSSVLTPGPYMETLSATLYFDFDSDLSCLNLGNKAEIKVIMGERELHIAGEISKTTFTATDMGFHEFSFELSADSSKIVG